jgi:hypothetical protein
MGWAAGLCLLAATCGASALTFEDVIVSESYGTGGSSAMCVIDFGPRSYAFLYRFDGARTGFDMLAALDAPNTGLQVDYTVFDFGIMIDDFAYNNQAKRVVTEEYKGWNYYTSADGVNWISSSVGCADRNLSNGSWDGWNYTGFDPVTWEPTAPPPVTPTPEPSSMVVLSSLLGLAASRSLRPRRG